MFHCKITTLIRDLKGLGLLTKRIEIVILVMKCNRRREKKQILNNPQENVEKPENFKVLNRAYSDDSKPLIL